MIKRSAVSNWMRSLYGYQSSDCLGKGSPCQRRPSSSKSQPGKGNKSGNGKGGAKAAHCPIPHGSPQSTCHCPRHVNLCHCHPHDPWPLLHHRFLQECCYLTSQILIKSHHKKPRLTDLGGSANAVDFGECVSVVDLAEWVKVNAVGMEGVGTHASHVDVVSGRICSLIPCHSCGGDKGTLGLVTSW